MASGTFTSQSSRQMGQRGDPFQWSAAGAGGAGAVAVAAAALARAMSPCPRAGPATTDGAALSLGGGVGAPSHAGGALARRLQVALWPRSFQSTVWQATEQ